MYAPAKIVLKSYIPDEIKSGMYFKSLKFYDQFGNETPIEQIWQLQHDVEDADKFMAELGAPVEPVICMQMDSNPDVEVAVIATFDQFGWVEYDETLYPIEEKDINYFLSEHGGYVGIYMCDDEEYEDEVHLEDGKIVLCPISDLYEDYDEEDEEEEY